MERNYLLLPPSVFGKMLHGAATHLEKTEVCLSGAVSMMSNATGLLELHQQRPSVARSAQSQRSRFFGGTAKGQQRGQFAFGNSSPATKSNAKEHIELLSHSGLCLFWTKCPELWKFWFFQPQEGSQLRSRLLCQRQKLLRF